MNKVILFVIIFAFSFIVNIQAQVAFPLKISDDRRYLVDQNNKPFPILGRTAWFIVSQTVQYTSRAWHEQAQQFYPFN